MARLRTPVFLAAVLAFAVAVPALRAAETVYRLGSGDRVKVTVFGHEDLSGEFVVDGSGRLTLPSKQDVAGSSLAGRAKSFNELMEEMG